MSASTAELTLIIKAQNLANAEFDKLKTKMSGIATTAKTVAGDIARSFLGMADILARQVVNVLGDIFTGDTKHIAADAAALGVTLAGALVEGVSITLIPMLMERVFASAAFAPVAAALEGGGLTLGAIFSTAIAVGAAALPFVLLAVAVAALVYLAVNPEARQKAHDIALMILGRIGDGLRALGKIMFDLFQAGLRQAQLAVENGIGTIIYNLLQIPYRLGQLWGQLVYNFKLTFYRIYYAVKKIIDQIVNAILAIPRAIAGALADLAKFGGTKFQVVYDRPPRGHASGGWVGLNGPELGVLGEKGPEYIVPNNKLGAMAAAPTGVTIVGVTEAEIIDMVDRGLYFKLRRAAPTSGRI